MVKNDCLEEQSLLNKNSQFVRQCSMLSRLALLWSCLAGARYIIKGITKGDGNGLESPHYCTVKALLLNRRAALCNCEILPSLVRCCQIVSGFVKSCQIASGHVSVFDCFLLWLCLAVCWLFFVVKTCKDQSQSTSCASEECQAGRSNVELGSSTAKERWNWSRRYAESRKLCRIDFPWENVPS